MRKIKMNLTLLKLVNTKESIKGYFTIEKKKEVITRYLKGIEIEDLALQFDCSKNIIEQILTNADIEIVSNKLPKGKVFRKRSKE